MTQDNNKNGNVAPFPGVSSKSSTVPQKVTTYNIAYFDGVVDEPTVVNFTGFGMMVGDCFALHDEQYIPLFIVPVSRLIRVITSTEEIITPVTAEDADVSTPN